MGGVFTRDGLCVQSPSLLPPSLHLFPPPNSAADPVAETLLTYYVSPERAAGQPRRALVTLARPLIGSLALSYMLPCGRPSPMHALARGPHAHVAPPIGYTRIHRNLTARICLPFFVPSSLPGRGPGNRRHLVAYRALRQRRRRPRGDSRACRVSRQPRGVQYRERGSRRMTGARQKVEKSVSWTPSGGD